MPQVFTSRLVAAFAVASGIALSGCAREDEPAEIRATDTPVSEPTSGGPESLPVTDSANLPTQPSADETGAPVAADGAPREPEKPKPE